MSLAAARIHKENGDLDEAEREGRQALSMARETEGPASIEYAVCANFVIGILYQKGDYEQAQVLCTEVMGILNTQVGPDDAKIVPCMQTMASLLMGQDKYQEAQEILSKAVVIRERTGSDSDAATGTTLHMLGSCQWNLDMNVEAVATLDRAYEIRSKRLGRTHAHTLATGVLSARAILDAGVPNRHFDCEERLQDAFLEYKGCHGIAHNDTKTVAAALAKFYGRDKRYVVQHEQFKSIVADSWDMRRNDHLQGDRTQTKKTGKYSHKLRPPLFPAVKQEHNCCLSMILVLVVGILSYILIVISQIIAGALEAR